LTSVRDRLLAESPSRPFADSITELYIVHMKRVTASEARRRWFTLLDEVLEGEVVAILRNGRRIILRLDEAEREGRKPPNYGRVLRVREPDAADEWRWEWTETGLHPADDDGDEHE
jgi:antitoxin (DNA-binding transcriptional repressor) of toxin-antitoxin stability system